jgi:hypothetical protein
MNGLLFWILLFSIFSFISCQNQTKSKQNGEIGQTSQTIINQQPNFNYIIEAPGDWTIRDTIMLDGLRVRLLLSPKSLSADNPVSNVLISKMNGRSINDYVTRNMNYLRKNMPGVIILERGSIDSTTYNGQWFTYSREENGIVRDMINYIIPLNGFAYSITCGSNKGSINKYRATFDKIARSFRG